MRKVGPSGGIVLEADDEAMSEFLVQSFGTVVGSPFDGKDTRYLIPQGREFPFHGLDCGGSGPLLELEADDVPDGIGFGLGVGG